MKAKNMEWLQSRFPNVIGLLDRRQEQFEGTNYTVVAARSGDLTIMSEDGDGKKVYWQSQYNPVQEAKNFVNQFNHIEENTHVLFYGCGLGYHVEAFAEKFPNLKISLYEPEPPLFFNWMKEREISNRLTYSIQNICLETDPAQMDIYLEYLLLFTTGQTMLVINPAYERLAEERVKKFAGRFRQHLHHRRYNLQANQAFQQYWVFNSVLNFQYTFQSPGFLQFKDVLKGKPVLIVSAGPSLQDEIENLALIRRQNSAYIFAVGSANKVLLANQIMPHAVFAYDASDLQTTVFKEIIENNYDQIPLVYGTYVGARLLDEYPGAKMHFVMSHDTVTLDLLKHEDLRQNDQIAIVSPSIAGVTLDLLCKLECDIYFVGQNLASRSDKYYAEGISYDDRSEEVTEEDQKRALIVKDVFGNNIQTFEELDLMRQSIESIRRNYPDVRVHNTTNGGAAIDQVPYIPLDEVMTQFNAFTADDNWYKAHQVNMYNRVEVVNHIEKLKASYEALKADLDVVSDLLKKIHLIKEQRKANKLYGFFPKLDAGIKKILNNEVYKIMIQPMNITGHDLLLQKINNIKFENNVFEKASQIVQNFGTYIYECQKAYSQTYGLMLRLLEVKEAEQAKSTEQETVGHESI
ncbi:motility associated factor glycosyltransferase family protein [Cohnella sp. GCM10012308]|uniref:motility associated factor glycosyltransferase family protein n=1 Tax=Cohnella sp. GCM10012308 TaxID=3317329 RepID=UPI003611C4F5